MAENQFGSDPQSLADAVAKMQQLAEAEAELDAKVEVFKGTEASATAAIRDNVDAVEQAIAATRNITADIERLTSLLGTEREALMQNTAAWTARAAAIERAATVGRSVQVAPIARAAAADTVGEDVALAETAAPRRARPAQESTWARGTRSMDEYDVASQAAAQRASQAAAERTYTQRLSTEQAAQAAADAQAQREAEAQRSAQGRRLYGSEIDEGLLGSVQRGVIRTDPTQVGRRELGQLPTAAPERLALPPGREPLALPAGNAQEAQQMRQAAQAAQQEADQTRALNEARKQAQGLAIENAEAEERLAAAYHQSVAAYAESSTALSRNGALTTEFIQAFARGDVTLKEFSSQMTSTIGKFAGWAVAGAAVYGAYDALKKLGEGAKETQEGVTQLSRFIPGVSSGPGEQQATQAFRNISTELNVPISEVTSSMAVMARSFHNVSDAADATRAVLLATRLDQISPDVAQQSFVGIAQSFGLSGKDLIGQVINPLNSLQNITGARVSQLLPAVSRAAPAAIAGGISLPQLMGLADVGVRAGLPGGQVGTALLRSISTMAFRPTSEATFREYGINPVQGQYGNLINQITDQSKPGGTIRNRQDVQNIAEALGGPQLGSRTLTAIVARLGAAQQATEIAKRPPQSAQQELNIVLGGVGEQAKRLGIELQNLGSELESAGILEPVQIALKAVGFFGEALNRAISPITAVAGLIDRMNSAVKDTLGVLAGAAVLQAARHSSAGFVVQSALGRVPGLSALRENPRQEVNAALSRYRTTMRPDLQRELESSNRQVVTLTRRAGDLRGQAKDLHAQSETALAAGQPGAATKLSEAAQEAQQKALAAEDRLATAQIENAQIVERVVQNEGMIATLSDKTLNYEQRAAFYAEQTGNLRGALNETLQGQIDAASKAMRAEAVGLTPLGQRQSAGSQAATDDAAVAAAGGAGSKARGVASDVFRQEPATEQLASVQESAELDDSGITQETVQNIGAETQTAAAALSGTPSPAATAESEEAQTAAGRSLGSRVGGVFTGDNQMALLGLSLAAGAIPGQAGSAISSIATPLGLGAFLSNTGVLSSAVSGTSGFAARQLSRIPGVELSGVSEETAARLDNPLIGAGLLLGASGAGKQGTGGLIQSVVGNALAGGTAGFVLGGGDPLIGAGGALAGAALGVGEHLLGGSGSKGSQVSALTRDRNQFMQSLTSGEATLGRQAGPNEQERLAGFSDQFNQTLNSAFSNGNLNQSQQEQTKVEAFVRQQAQLLNDAGVTTGVGQNAAGYLSTAIGAAASSAGFQKNPDLVGQIIDSAQSSLLTSTSNQEQYAVAQATTPGGDAAALAAERARFAQQRRERQIPVTQREQERTGEEASLRGDRTRLAGEVAQRQTLTAGGADEATSGMYTSVGQPGTASDQGKLAQVEAAIKSARSAINQNLQDLSNTDARLKNAKEVFKGLDIKQLQQTQSDAANTLQAMDQQYSDIAGLATARAGGNRMAQYQATITQSAHQLRAAQTLPGLSPQARQSQERQAQAQEITAQTGKVTEQAARLQAQQSAGLANIDQTVNPVQYAQQAAENARAYYQYVQSHSHDFDATDISAALQNMRSANKALADATYSYQSTVISDMEQLQEAQNPDNAVAAGQFQAAAGRSMLHIARNRPQRIEAQSQIASGNTAAAEAARSNSDVIYQITQSEETGNPVEQALTQLAQARHDLATALGPDEVRQAREELASANAALHQAQQDQITALGSLAASETNNQLKQDTDLLNAAQKKLSQAIHEGLGPQVTQADTTSRNQAALQKFNDSVSQAINTIQYQTSTLQISSQDALQKYQKMLKDDWSKLSVSQRQSLKSAIYDIETNMDNTSLFDLAPSGAGVKVPTIYDARTAAARERQRLRDQGVGRRGGGGGGVDGFGHGHLPSGHVEIGGASIATSGGAMTTYDTRVERAVRDLISVTRESHGGAAGTGNVTVNVHVGKGEAHKVADAIDRTLGSRVHARMRAAGVRGT